jgi:hypothetical protein
VYCLNLLEILCVPTCTVTPPSVTRLDIWAGVPLFCFVCLFYYCHAAAAGAVAGAGQSARHALLISILQTNPSTPPTAKRTAVCVTSLFLVYIPTLCVPSFWMLTASGEGSSVADCSTECCLLSENVHCNLSQMIAFCSVRQRPLVHGCIQDGDETVTELMVHIHLSL